MKRMLVLTTWFALLALLTLSGVALADGGRKVAVKPLIPKVGDAVTVVGAGLGANRSIEIRLVGQGVDVDLGEVQSMEDGDFEGEFTLSADLKPGSYQLKAIGEGTEATQVTILAAGGSGAATAPAIAMGAEATEVVQQRPLGEAAILVALFGILAALGLFFARTARGEPVHEGAAH